MKTAFFLTDCSVDSALVLRRWLESNPDNALHLTVVHPYDIEECAVLNKETFRAAKQQAESRLERWLDMLPQLSKLKAETLFSSPQLAIKMHLLLRSYDYLLMNEQTFTWSADTETFLRQTTTKLCRLTAYDGFNQMA
ncbi:hypothetical protein G8759_02790 [Spirosoma aureum]|uniref:Universal stress protein n=1 Tax=Spirosoma aureum TaxID=2692134 RepID=A0A6G9AHH0_9BACT|nr:hypothetical protein [Spirosoma aureum]QIP11633.1 hypothetical protein G8759_02790 [Spirosoma aureum]